MEQKESLKKFQILLHTIIRCCISQNMVEIHLLIVIMQSAMICLTIIPEIIYMNLFYFIEHIKLLFANMQQIKFLIRQINKQANKSCCNFRRICIKFIQRDSLTIFVCMKKSLWLVNLFFHKIFKNKIIYEHGGLFCVFERCSQTFINL